MSNRKTLIPKVHLLLTIELLFGLMFYYVLAQSLGLFATETMIILLPIVVCISLVVNVVYLCKPSKTTKLDKIFLTIFMILQPAFLFLVFLAYALTRMPGN